MASGFPDYQSRMFTSAENFEQLKVSVTAADTLATFAKQVKSIIIYNDGPYTIYINFDAVATVNKFKVPSGSSFFIDLAQTVVHLICAATQTADCRIIGVW